MTDLLELTGWNHAEEKRLSDEAASLGRLWDILPERAQIGSHMCIGHNGKEYEFTRDGWRLWTHPLSLVGTGQTTSDFKGLSVS